MFSLFFCSFRAGMMDRFFIEEPKLVREVLKKLSTTKEHSGYQREIYIDNEAGQKWEKYLFENEETGEDAVGLRKLPYPETEEIIRIALTSPYLDEVDGACALLILREYDNIEFREKLILEIEKNVKDISKERYEIIYNRAELNDIANKREILGKHYTEIEQDARHYVQMMERAESLKRITSNNV
jgi:hypothetical protein